MFSVLDQKRAEAVRTLQEHCAFPSNEDFINALEFKVTSAFGARTFEPLVTWMRQDLHVDLTTCAADLYVPRVENVIRLVKERIVCIQCETLFTKFTKRLTIEMVKRVTILINSFRGNSGVHPVMSPRQLMFGKKSKPPLNKIGELVMAYDVTSKNMTAYPRAFFAL